MSVPGSDVSLPKAAAQMAHGWMQKAGWDLLFRYSIQSTDLVVGSGSPQERVLLAAACDLVDLLAQSPEGRQALRDLGLEPVLENFEGK